MRSIHIYLDDDLEYRNTPPGYLRFTTGESLIDYMNDNNPEVGTISFDNDLGEDVLEGYDVVKEMISSGWNVKNVVVHSANIVAKNNMQRYILSANRAGVSNITLIRR